MIDTDEIERVIDERATRAAADLGRAAHRRALPDLPVRRSTRARAVLVTICVAVLVIGGLFVIADRPGPRPADAPNGATLWTIGALPDGWDVQSVRAPQPVDPTGIINAQAIYATADAPAGPVISIDLSSVVMNRFPAEARGDNIVESTVADRRVVLADGLRGTRQAWVEIDEHWVAFQALHTSDDQLRAMAAAIDIDAANRVFVSPDRLPAGFTAGESGPYLTLAPALWVGLNGQVSASPTISVDYQGPRDGQGVTLTVARSARSEMPMLALLATSLERANIGEITAWFVEYQPDNDGSAVVWEHDGSTFVLTGIGLSHDEMLDLASSVRSARAGELPISSDPMGDAPAETVLADGTFVPTTDDVSNPDDAPADTVPAVSTPVDFEPFDVDLDVDAVSVSPNEVTLSGQLADGFAFEADVIVVAGTYFVSPRANGESMGSMGGSAIREPADQVGPNPDVAVFGGGGATAAVAITDDDAAARLEVVRSNGERFLVELQSTSADPSIRFAVVVVPSGEVVTAKLLDRDGKVIDEAFV